MTDDELAKAVTQVPGFEWRPGMVCKPGRIVMDVGCSNGVAMLFLDPATQPGCMLPDDASIDLDHRSNTGHMVDVWKVIQDNGYPGETLLVAGIAAKYHATSDKAGYSAAGINRLLARAIVAAHKVDNG